MDMISNAAINTQAFLMVGVSPLTIESVLLPAGNPVDDASMARVLRFFSVIHRTIDEFIPFGQHSPAWLQPSPGLRSLRCTGISKHINKKRDIYLFVLS